MKIKLKNIKGRPALLVRYEESEWNKIEKILKNTLKLDKREIINGFGRRLRFEAYAETEENLQKYIQATFTDAIRFSFIDNLNSLLYNDGILNIAIFRIVPDKKYEITIPLEKYFTVVELNDLVTKLTSIYKVILEIVNDVEISVNFNGD